MKKTKFIILCSIIALAIITFVIVFISVNNANRYKDVPSFDYSFYEPFMKLCEKVELNVGPINDKETAIDKAEKAWEWKFGSEMLQYIRENEQPYQVRYNPDKKMWLIQGYLEQNVDVDGGSAVTIIGDDGTVYLIYHDGSVL